MTPEILATAQRIHAEAQASHLAAAEKAGAIQSRIAAAQLRQSEITTARINGTSSPAEAAEFAALGGDVEALQKMLTAAQAASASLLADHHAAADNLRIVEQQHAIEQTRATFDALKSRAEMLEAAFCGCVAELHGHGQKLGNVSLVMSFRPTQRLANIVQGIRL